MSLRFSLLGLIGLTTLAGLASAALVQPGIGWTSFIVSLTAAMLAWQALRLLLTTGESRAAATGWLLFAVGYLAVTLGPWFNSRLGPHLLSSKALVYSQLNWRQENPNGGAAVYQQMLNVDFNGPAYNGPAYNGTSSTIWLDGGWGTYAAGAAADPTASANYFHLSGHWLCAWIAGWLGAVLAVHFQRRSFDA